MIQRKIGMITVRTQRTGIPMPLFPGFDEDAPEETDECDEGCEDCADGMDEIPDAGESEDMELTMEGKLVLTDQRVELVWHESELTGMEGSTTKIGFAKDEPQLISMLRSGSVNTALVFEKGQRHYCIYNTPFSSFEVCVQALHTENRLLTDGTLLLNYLIEVRGNRTERCRMEIAFVETE